MPNEDNESNKGNTLKDDWLIRPCDVYLEEYKDCRSITTRFNQYFVHGETLDCSPWKRDYDNCLKWVESNDTRSAEEIVKSEKQRRLIRLKGHYGNNVWGKRKEPPATWNDPLPQYIQEEYKNSYLDIKSREMKGEIEPTIDSKCIIM